VESTNTPSRSKRIAEQWKIGMYGGGALAMINAEIRIQNAENLNAEGRSQNAE
jgi:hypothetical protein